MGIGRSGSALPGARRAFLLAALVAFVVPAAAHGGFPADDPAESPRANAPDDPAFDRCEPDDPDTPAGDCTSYWEEQFGAFGFSPESANEAPGLPHGVAATRYRDCSQLDRQGRAANRSVGDPECAQIAGVRADTAWKHSTGDPDVVIAILDTGIRWQEPELVNKIHLNAAELPAPRSDRSEPLAGSRSCSAFTDSADANGDGAFDVRDFACDARVAVDAGDTESDDMLDGSDLIATFSDGIDDDGNGYVDDIAGWDFFDDDNDPFDASSCCSAGGHGTGRAREAAAETNNARSSAGICPRCQIMPLRVWDSFVVDTNLYAMGVVYAAEAGASVVEGAIGGLVNSAFARRSFAYADRKGVALTLVSSDINSANHNYPTNYNEAIYVAGALPDTAPYDTCDGAGSLPGLGDVLELPGPLAEGCGELLRLLAEFDLNPTLQPITTSFFRNSNLTQYGGKADIVMMGSTGSEATGQASGAAGLVQSFARERFAGMDLPRSLSGNEVRQVLTMTAEDVLPANTGSIGLPDKANRGWDTHFGYGRVDLAAAMARIANDHWAGDPPCDRSKPTCVPPEAQLDAPDWFAPIDVDRVPAEGVPIEGRAAAPHSDAGVGAWEVEYACGQGAADSDFLPIPGADGTGPADGLLGHLPMELLEELAEDCDGSVSGDPGRPAGTLADPWPLDPYPDPDPERHAFQIRLTVHEANDPDNFGRYRKTLFAYRDDGNLDGWPRPVGSGSAPEKLVTGSGGEASPRLFDLDGDNGLDVLLPTSSGELWALRADGTPLESWNGGEPVRTMRYRVARAHPPPPGVGNPPREPLRNPAIGDIDGDLEPEIVDTAGEHVYAWNHDGSPVPRFPRRIDPSLSEPCLASAPKPCFDASERTITTDNHIKRGFIGSPTLADLDGDDRLDIVTGSLDQHLYAWDGEGEPLPSFPVKLATEGATGAEIVTSPAIADLDGDGSPEVIVGTNEVLGGDPTEPRGLPDLLNAFVGSATSWAMVYAIHGHGAPVEGWPVQVGTLAPDLLPLVGPGNDAAVLDVDGDGDDEVAVSAFTGFAQLRDGDGETISQFTNQASPNVLDPGPVINIADYPLVGDLTGSGSPAVLKNGLTLNGAANLLAANQNLPFNHVVQAWDPETGLSLPGYPRATDDYQFLTQSAIAKVDAAGDGRQALVPTGLYQLHAYGPRGEEAPGWPKFTGGWLTTTPAAGDADGDGDLDVTTVTREGWSFLWDTGAPACSTDGGTTTNEEWWTFHHDEHGTANYGHDARPPGAPAGLRAVRDPDDGSVSLSWTAPGDDWLCGKADRLRVLLSDQAIESPADARQALDLKGGAGSGASQRRDLDASEVGEARYAAVLYRDEAGNWGHLAATGIEPIGGGGEG